MFSFRECSQMCVSQLYIYVLINDKFLRCKGVVRQYYKLKNKLWKNGYSSLFENVVIY